MTCNPLRTTDKITLVGLNVYASGLTRRMIVAGVTRSVHTFLLLSQDDAIDGGLNIISDIMKSNVHRWYQDHMLEV